MLDALLNRDLPSEPHHRTPVCSLGRTVIKLNFVNVIARKYKLPRLPACG